MTSSNNDHATESLRPETALVTAGRDTSAQKGFVNPPVVRGSTVLYPTADDLHAHRGEFQYGRHGTPTTKALQQALMALEEQIQSTGLEKSLIELVKIRASQINGCAFCINMHTEDARKRGETEQRIYLLDAWRESPLYTDRERAALAWTESVTLIAETHAPDDVYEQVRTQFSDAETVNLTALIGAINAWNRLAIAFRAVHPVKVKASVA